MRRPVSVRVASLRMRDMLRCEATRDSSSRAVKGLVR
jgi:hypothetical protein